MFSCATVAAEILGIVLYFFGEVALTISLQSRPGQPPPLSPGVHIGQLLPEHSGHVAPELVHVGQL
jgi:hypothetical protein